MRSWTAIKRRYEQEMIQYRLFFDESGDRSQPKDGDFASRYFALCGCIFELDIYKNDFRKMVENLRSKHFPEHDKEEPVILHREDIKRKGGAFAVLQEDPRRVAFDFDLLSLIGESSYHVVVVVLDKQVFFARSGSGADPHARCLWELLERYCCFLRATGSSGDVLGEARNSHSDKPIKDAYAFYWSQGERQGLSHTPLSSKEVKLKPKANDILGTQLADLLAYPLKQDILRENGLRDEVGGFTLQVCNRVRGKYLEDGRSFVRS